jgi:excinuclease ABC subunit B
MSKFKLKSKFKPTGDQPQAIIELTKSFKSQEKLQTLLGVTGSGKTFTMANVIEKLGKKTLVLAPNKTLAAQLYGEFKEFFPDNAVEFFVSYYDYYQPEAYVPGTDTYIEKDASINDEIDKLRHSATKSLLSRNDVIVVASVSCIYGIGDPAEYESQKITMFTGDVLDRDKLLKDLVSIQYERNDFDFSRGKFRVRGDVVEVFPASEDSNVIRIEFFGDEVEAMSWVDPLRGSLISQVEKITIFPKSHYVVGEEKLKRAIFTIKEELRERLIDLEKQGKLVEKQRLEQRTLLDLEMLEEMGFCSGIENYSRHLTGLAPGSPPPTLIDYFKKDFLLIVDESHITIPQIGGMYNGDRSRKENLVNYGFRLPSALDNRPLKFDEFIGKTDQLLFVSATPGPYELEQTKGEFVEQIIRPTGLLDPIIEVKNAKNQVDEMLVQAKKTIKEGARVLITTLTKKLAEELTNYFKSLGLRIRYLHSDIATIERMEIIQDLRKGEFDILVGINLLREGLDIPEVSLVGVLDADKEGFLRSERSLIQTIGRAARNSQGRVILFAYQETGSMKKAIFETNRRRKIQEKYNLENNITPMTINKAIQGGVLETLRGVKEEGRKFRKEELEFKGEITPEKIQQRIILLKDMMKKASRDLAFEEAAAYRDEIKELNEALLAL